MTTINRVSPVAFDCPPVKTETREHWNIHCRYDGEGNGPYLIDLSHRARIDVQHSDLETIHPMGVKIPANPGKSIYQKGILVNRMNRTQASVWHLSGPSPEIPEEPEYTDVTDVTAFLALVGKDIFSITETLTALDLFAPGKTPPFLLQGPFSHVPCQMVVMGTDGDASGLLFTCSRGYGQSMAQAILDAGKAYDLRPAGEDAFRHWISAEAFQSKS